MLSIRLLGFVDIFTFVNRVHKSEFDMFSLCCEPQLLKLDIFAFLKTQILYEKNPWDFFSI